MPKRRGFFVGTRNLENGERNSINPMPKNKHGMQKNLNALQKFLQCFRKILQALCLFANPEAVFKQCVSKARGERGETCFGFLSRAAATLGFYQCVSKARGKPKDDNSPLSQHTQSRHKPSKQVAKPFHSTKMFFLRKKKSSHPCVSLILRIFVHQI